MKGLSFYGIRSWAHLSAVSKEKIYREEMYSLRAIKLALNINIDSMLI